MGTGEAASLRRTPGYRMGTGMNCGRGIVGHHKGSAITEASRRDARLVRQRIKVVGIKREKPQTPVGLWLSGWDDNGKLNETCSSLLPNMGSAITESQ
jgi:hypothetical protein